MINARLIQRLAIVLVLHTLSGCQMLTSGAEAPVALKLLPPAQGPAPVLLKQVVTLEAKGQRQQFLVVSRLQLTAIEMVALMPTGQRLMTLEYDGKALRQEQLSSIPLPGKDILALLQFALWPANSVNQHYPEYEGWLATFEPEQRQLTKNTMRVLKVANQEPLMVENFIGNYRVLIKTLESTAL